MKTLRNKIAAITLSLFFILSMAASATLIPSASAHSPPWDITDKAYMNFSPNPIGVGQLLSIEIWTAQPMPNALLTNNIRKGPYYLTITAPNGAVTSQSWLLVDNPGGEQATSFTPTMTGSYMVNFTFGGETYPPYAAVFNSVPNTAAQIASIEAYAGDVFLPDTTIANFTVQSAPIVALNGAPPPTFFWTTPINGQNTQWVSVASNWLGAGSSYQFGSTAISGWNVYQPSGTAPTTGHVLWTYPIEFGGVVGGVPIPGEAATGPMTEVEGATYYSGSSYQPRFYNSIIMDGYLYFKEPFGGNGLTVTVAGKVYAGNFVCVDLFTGQTVWTNTNPAFNPTWAQLYYEGNPNQSGTIPSGYLIQSVTVTPSVAIHTIAGQELPGVMSNVTWMFFSGWNGAWEFNITNVPQAWTVYGTGAVGRQGVMLAEQTIESATDHDGSQLRYVLDYNTVTEAGWLALWNTTTLIDNIGIAMSIYRPEGQIINGAAHEPYNTQPYTNYETAYFWNVTIKADLNGWAVNGSSTSPPGVSLTGPSIQAVIPGNIMMGTSSSLGEAVGPQFTPNPFTMWAINLNSSIGTVGAILWEQNYTAPDLMGAGNPYLGSYTQRMGDVDPLTGVITMQIGETFEWLGYSLYTGDLLWGPTTTPFPNGFQYFGSGLGIGQYAANAYGKIFVQGYGGEVWCYDTSNGDLLWQFGNGPLGSDNSTSDGINSPWGLLPTQVWAVCDGMVYVYSEQHGNGAQSPYYKGERLWDLNATTGKQIWVEDFQAENNGGPGTPEGAIADGIIAQDNMYDNQIYAFGQGPSQTTINAPNIGVTTATPITITGTVMDISAGTKETQQAADFPNGVPCVSDASESLFMDYVYQQQPEPTNTTGVPVTLSVLDVNHNTYTIGTTTTNALGDYSFVWTPPITGNYTIYATFAGTGAYYGSSDSIGIYAGPPAATPAPTAAPVTGLASTSTVELGVVALAIVIVVIGIVLAMLLMRKRP